MNVFSFWLRNARWTALPQSMLPALTAVSFASGKVSFSIGYALLAVLGVAFAHLACNLFDDYFDFKKKGAEIRMQMTLEGMRARTGKCNYITSGAASLKTTFYTACVFALIALVAGFFIFLKRGMSIVVITAIAGILGLFYSAPPFRFSYRGFGEIIIGILFGPLLMLGICYAACGAIYPDLWYISIPIGLLVANIIYTHDIMDLEADRKNGKKTLCVLIQNKTLILILSAMFIFLPFGLIIIGVCRNILSDWYLFLLFILPSACYLFYLLIQFEKEPSRVFTPKWWMQPMERWSKIEKAGIGWFMIRWYLARNILIYFCTIIIVITLFVL